MVITISSKWLFYILLETVRGRNESFESLKNNCFKRKFCESKDKANCEVYYLVYSFGMIRNKMGDLRSLGSCCIKGSDGSTLGGDSSLPFIRRCSRITNNDVDLPKRTHPLRSCGSVVYLRCQLIPQVRWLEQQNGLCFVV